MRCVDKHLKGSQRLGDRFQEQNATMAQTGGLPGGRAKRLSSNLHLAYHFCGRYATLSLRITHEKALHHTRAMEGCLESWKPSQIGSFSQKLTIAHLSALWRPLNTSLLRVSRVYVYKAGCSVLHSNPKSPLEFVLHGPSDRALTRVPLFRSCKTV